MARTPTRIETKQRLHKRPQARAALLLSEDPGPFDTVALWTGRLPRQDFKSYPYFAGLGPEVQLEGLI